MALATQTKILRVLQQGDIQRVGGTETIHVDVRIIAATNKDLEALVKAKSFREDLYYRLNVVRIKMPPLRDRSEDIPQIVDFCLQNLVRQRKARVSKVSAEAMAVLVRFPWPGNVRELENVIYRSAVVAQGDAILVKDLPPEIRGTAGDESSAAPTLEAALDFVFQQLSSKEGKILPHLEREMAARALKADAGDTAAAAKRLGVTPAALQKRLKS
jgi:two-component system nitrogen regulation response regulator GlnG